MHVCLCVCQCVHCSKVDLSLSLHTVFSPSTIHFCGRVNAFKVATVHTGTSQSSSLGWEKSDDISVAVSMATHLWGSLWCTELPDVLTSWRLSGYKYKAENFHVGWNSVHIQACSTCSKMHKAHPAHCHTRHHRDEQQIFTDSGILWDFIMADTIDFFQCSFFFIKVVISRDYVNNNNMNN